MALDFLSFKHGGKTESPVMPVTDFGLNHCHKRTLQLGRRTISGNVGYTDANICDNVPICHRYLPRYSHLPLVAAPAWESRLDDHAANSHCIGSCLQMLARLERRGGKVRKSWGWGGDVLRVVEMCYEWWGCAASGGDVMQVYMGRYSVMDCSCV